MRIIAFTNDGQLPMMKNMLNSALKTGWDLTNFHCYFTNLLPQSASYNTLNFQSLTLKKLELILMNMRMDSEVMWIDNDIVLFENCLENLRSFPGNFVMQDDLWGPCTGFFLVRSSPKSIETIEKTITFLKQKLVKTILNDQHAFVEIIKKIPGLQIYLLSQKEYPNGEIYFKRGMKDGARMVHNNYLSTTPEKVHRFKECGLWDESDEGFNKVNKYQI